MYRAFELSLGRFMIWLVLILLVQRSVQDVEFEWPVTEEVPLPKLRPSIDRCPRWFKKYVVVVAGTKHNSDWIRELGNKVEVMVYQQEDANKPHFYTVRGNEAGAYLTYIIDYYNCLPEVTAFIHGHKEDGWHQFDMLDTLHKLQWHLIPGYTDLNRKQGIWTRDLRHRPSRPNITPNSAPVATGDDVYDGRYPPQAIFGGEGYDWFDTMLWWSTEVAVHAYDRFFGRAGLGAMPANVSFACCSQFAVTREAVHKRTRFFWQQNLHYLKHNNIERCNSYDKTYMVGDIWTHFWPMLFGKSAQYKLEIPEEELFADQSHPAHSRI